jgi:hypothetical protein
MDSESAIARQGLGVDLGRTRWSMVVAVREGNEREARRSLGELCRRYWVPVYAYVRRAGRSPEDAASLVQAFLSHLVARLRAGEQRISAGFREFLQAEIEAFLASDGQEQASAELLPEMLAPWSLERIEARQSFDRQGEMSPGQALQRAFALEMLSIALERLRKEAEDSERGELFEAVRPFLSREPGPEDYAALAEQMGSSPLAAIVAVKRLRQRFQELIDEELAQTIGDKRELETERHTLLTIVSPGRKE